MRKKTSKRPLLYYRTEEQIRAYQEIPVREKLRWLQMQMEFYHKAMPDRAKRIREKINRGEL